MPRNAATHVPHNSEITTHALRSDLRLGLTACTFPRLRDDLVLARILRPGRVPAVPRSRGAAPQGRGAVAQDCGDVDHRLGDPRTVVLGRRLSDVREPLARRRS